MSEAIEEGITSFSNAVRIKRKIAVVSKRGVSFQLAFPCIASFQLAFFLDRELEAYVSPDRKLEAYATCFPLGPEHPLS
ncbi:MAG: hypothetical protein RIK87_02925 [Fuerstiella sp.]